jgi:hypothetical protein
MFNTDLDSAERLMYQRVEEELRQARLRRLQREAGATDPGRLRAWTSRAMDRLGSLFISAGLRLKQAGRAQRISAQEHADSRA